MDPALDTQHVELLSKINTEKATLNFAHKSCPHMKRNLIGKIFRFALSKIFKKTKLLILNHALETCPHQIRLIITNDDDLSLYIHNGS